MTERHARDHDATSQPASSEEQRRAIRGDLCTGEVLIVSVRRQLDRILSGKAQHNWFYLFPTPA
jgi:hypothetical protein